MDLIGCREYYVRRCRMDNKVCSIIDDHMDDHVDAEIQECILATPPKSFFMFAGAGSGKTRSLINTLEYLDTQKGAYLMEHGKQVAVITYTNAACDEIERRLQYKSIFSVSTIHSFLWELIKNFQTDIKKWLTTSLQSDIDDLMSKQTKARGGAAAKREEKIEKKKKRLNNLQYVTRFTYNPNGDNVGIDSLSHEEVVKIGSEFIATEETLQEILVGKYPFLLIDESQDTKKELVDALLCVYKMHKEHWLMGMFGDTMQRIYTDGKANLENAIPTEWIRPVKVMNHRSAKRIVSLSNEIRKYVDDKKQQPRSDANEGTIRLFITSINADKERIESEAAKQMAIISCDKNWLEPMGYKSLILEHHMAASRFSFSGIFTPLNDSKVFDTALRSGEIAELSFLANTVLPLINAYREENEFEITKILRHKSPLLDKKYLLLEPEKQQQKLAEVENAANGLFALWKDNSVPSCIEVLRNIKASGLFAVTDRIDDVLDESYGGNDVKVLALKNALNVSFEELERYALYVTEKTRFATHQGIKGLEYPRVMVVLDDSEAKGFLFSYEKLFGAKEKTETDKKNEEEGKDTSLLRTARLFYVACTRAKDSLAVVVYSQAPDKIKETAISNGWFSKSEIIFLD